MSFYSEPSVLAAIDDHTVLVLALCGGALVANVVWFVLGLRAGERDRAYSTAALAVLVFLPHDTSYVYRYADWFDDRDHWFPRLFWVALIAMVVFELLFLRQLVRYGHRELLPFLTKRQFQLAIAAAVASSFVGWEMAKAALDDALYLGSFHVLILLSPVFGAGLLTRRGTSAGQTPGMWLAFSTMAALWTTGSVLGLGPTVRDGLWVTTGVVSTVWGLALAWLIARAPRPAADSSAGSPGRAGALARS
ncbi:MAG: hypothetical protein ACT4QG_02685 [Sporichthyaceae bacterium]